MEVYLYIVAAVIILGMIMPQQGQRKKYYIIAMAVLHAFVCGFRYMYLTGDLRNYAADYYAIVDSGWLSENVLQEGRNTGFFMLMKLFSGLTNGDFQIFLIFLAIVTEVLVAVAIYKYSPIPWCSYLVWNCLGFYVSGFSSIKQGLAMAILMWAFYYIVEERPAKFTAVTLLAGFIHMPALCFLPAYWLAKRKITFNTIVAYLLAGAVLYLFRTQAVNFIGTFYYEEETFVLQESALGGRFFMIIAILLCGLVLKGFQEKNFSKLFNLLIVAAIFQMLSGFDNIFTRLADYYFQFSILYIPMLFSNYPCNTEIDRSQSRAILPFNDRSLKIMLAVVVVVLIWFYYNYNIGVEIEYAVDDYTNFRFMWDVTG
ncbi:MAG: EpsG family protein [Clostridiales bacterium]|nr:EpsG family protein [Clostridiales bacterium]